jgi:hypothetical protein
MLSLAECEHATVSVVATDLFGGEFAYTADYWLCTDSQVAPISAMAICYEGGNPYARVLYAHPASAPDVEWLCESG